MKRQGCETVDVLKRFVKARRLRSGVRSVDLELVPTGGGSQGDDYADLCQLVAGVPEWTLKLLDVWWCEANGSVWEAAALEIRGVMHNLPIDQVPVRFTLSEAAQHLGVKMTFQQARALYMEARAIVLDNLVKRAAASERLQNVVE